MRFFSAALLSACLATSAALSVFKGESQTSISGNENLEIPGKSPLQYCNLDAKHHKHITIESVDLIPNPPAAGQQLVVKANGTVHQRIEKGAYIELVVKYGLIRLIKTTVDLCEQMGEVDIKCPVDKGPRVITKTVDMPSVIPPGTYNVQADVFTVDGEPITCLTASVTFNKDNMGFLDGEL